MKHPIPFHPLADVWPLLEGKEFTDLVDSIRQNGLRQSITVFDDMILDGRNRYLACTKEAGIENPRTEEFVGSFEDARKLVVDLNDRRRHSTPSQRGMAAAKLAKIKNGENQFTMQQKEGSPRGPPSLTIDDAAKMLKIGSNTVKRAKAVLSKGSTELIAAVERGEVPVKAAAEIVKTAMPKEDQLAAATSRKSRPRKVAASPSAKAPRKYPRIANTIVAPEMIKNETDEQKAVRWFLFFASGDLDICNKIMREIGLDKVQDESRIQELLSASSLVIEAWEKIKARLSSNLKPKG